MTKITLFGGQVLFSQGDAADNLYIVISGTIRLLRSISVRDLMARLPSVSDAERSSSSRRQSTVFAQKRINTVARPSTAMPDYRRGSTLVKGIAQRDSDDCIAHQNANGNANANANAKAKLTATVCVTIVKRGGVVGEDCCTAVTACDHTLPPPSSTLSSSSSSMRDKRSSRMSATAEAKCVREYAHTAVARGTVQVLQISAQCADAHFKVTCQLASS